MHGNPSGRSHEVDLICRTARSIQIFLADRAAIASGCIVAGATAGASSGLVAGDRARPSCLFAPIAWPPGSTPAWSSARAGTSRRSAATTRAASRRGHRLSPRPAPAGQGDRSQARRPWGARTTISTRKFDRWGDSALLTRTPALGWRLPASPTPRPPSPAPTGAARPLKRDGTASAQPRFSASALSGSVRQRTADQRNRASAEAAPPTSPRRARSSESPAARAHRPAVALDDRARDGEPHPRWTDPSPAAAS